MKRDRRLLFAIFAFGASFLAVCVQAWITASYVFAAVMGQWDQFSELFGVASPPEFCFDYCAPKLPIMAGLVALALFWIGLTLITIAWWNPKK
ncbi:hypothetical protein [Alteraurantiacibacter aquimixticola]|uniref:Disulfide bond formation protein B n=1 Tax=Alteraurantiacibacter aquimixticola TaxID=2489173 RepID=A0A4T3F187_9SPHN|nr:hypothetical protein [Alteraurantiacibacter aquimixticola]TIX50327.1 hypothetical protein E5222_08585 [Alteraurantiacibacter aquimixticola]